MEHSCFSHIDQRQATTECMPMAMRVMEKARARDFKEEAVFEHEERDQRNYVQAHNEAPTYPFRQYCDTMAV